MIEEAPNTFILSEDEQEMVDLLKDEMGLDSNEEVMNLLVRQAIKRVAITCPQCGHYAARKEEDKVECRSCLSVITLSESLWETSQQVTAE
ncbi:MAG: hypothetical protein GY759_00535 [Chloroflexi bacterium]|nr:hypothetical protein [Chloroflexota bacterium]